jgi:hypothetical protein
VLGAARVRRRVALGHQHPLSWLRSARRHPCLCLSPLLRSLLRGGAYSTWRTWTLAAAWRAGGIGSFAPAASAAFICTRCATCLAACRGGRLLPSRHPGLRRTPA